MPRNWALVGISVHNFDQRFTPRLIFFTSFRHSGNYRKRLLRRKWTYLRTVQRDRITPMLIRSIAHIAITVHLPEKVEPERVSIVPGTFNFCETSCHIVRAGERERERKKGTCVYAPFNTVTQSYRNEKNVEGARWLVWSPTRLQIYVDERNHDSSTRTSGYVPVCVSALLTCGLARTHRPSIATSPSNAGHLRSLSTEYENLSSALYTLLGR